jgi:hypothetical protein
VDDADEGNVNKRDDSLTFSIYVSALSNEEIVSLKYNQQDKYLIEGNNEEVLSDTLLLSGSVNLSW